MLILINDQSDYFKSLLVIGQYTSVVHFTHWQQVVWLLSSNDKSTGHFSKIDNEKRDLGNKDGSAEQIWREIMLEVNYVSKWKMLAAIWETLNVPEELSEEKFTDINEESGHDEKDKDVSEETMLANKQTNKKPNPK